MLNQRDKGAAHKYRLLQAQRLIDLAAGMATAAGPAAPQSLHKAGAAGKRGQAPPFAPAPPGGRK